MAGKKHPERVRAAAQAKLLAGYSVSEVARAHRVPEPTVRRWRKQAHRAVRADGPMSGLLRAASAEGLRTLAAQAERFRDPAWLAEQSAAELGVLHGVMFDKTVRLLDGLQGG